MRVSNNSLIMPQNNSINVHRINQSVEKQKGVVQGMVGCLKRDTVSISPKGKVASFIDNLMKQKIEILERKNSFVASAVEKGQSMDAIRSQVELYDEQIKNIDKQIAEMTTQQMKQEAEKNEPKTTESSRPKTEQEIQNEKLANITKLSTGLEKIEAVDSAKTRVDGDIGVLKSEIELDKMYSSGTQGSMDMIAKKEAQLAEKEAKSMTLTVEIGEQLVETSEKVKENNDQAMETGKVEGNRGGIIPEEWSQIENDKDTFLSGNESQEEK